MSENKTNRFSPRLITSYMVGLYLGVNSLKDFYLLVDGPDCSYMKTQFISLNQDLYSNLTNLSGFHRITNTALHPIIMAGSREERLISTLKKIAAQPFVKALGITPMPMAAVTAVDYKRLLRDVYRIYKKPLMEFKNRSLSGDWMDGYMEFAKTIASEIRLEKRKKKRTIGIVGYLFDRNEYDNFANIMELKRLFEKIGVSVCSVWFEGKRYNDLSKIAESSLIISFGYMKEAAEILGDRLKVPVIHLDYPLGIDTTIRMLESVSDFFGIMNSKRYIEEEITSTVRIIEPLVEQYLCDLKVFYCGDPIIFSSLYESLRLFGVKFKYVVITNTSDKRRYIKNDLKDLMIEPAIKDAYETAIKVIRQDEIDVYIGNSDMSSYFIGSGKPSVEIGFPSYFSHSLYYEPYLGFGGFLSFLSRLVKELRFGEVRDVFEQKRGPLFI